MSKYKELSDRITISFEKLTEMHQNMDYLHMLILKYIKFNDDEQKFLKFVEEERNREEKKVRENESKL